VATPSEVLRGPSRGPFERKIHHLERPVPQRREPPRTSKSKVHDCRT